MLLFDKAETWIRGKLEKRPAVTAAAVVAYEELLDELTRQQREQLAQDSNQPASFRLLLELPRLRRDGRETSLSMLELGALLRNEINARLSIAKEHEYAWVLEVADGPPAEGLYQIEPIQLELTRKFQRMEPSYKAAAAVCSLKALSGPVGGKTAVFTKPVITLGRSKEQDFCLLDESASRLHAYVRCENGVFILYDADSLNGTYVNSKRVTRSVLASGDTIRIGQSVLTFSEVTE